jgi:hypothetical protein
MLFMSEIPFQLHSATAPLKPASTVARMCAKPDSAAHDYRTGKPDLGLTMGLRKIDGRCVMHEHHSLPAEWMIDGGYQSCRAFCEA